MAYTALNLHKVSALVAAVMVTLGVQGSMLASFDNLAAAPMNASSNAACNVVNQPATGVPHARG